MRLSLRETTLLAVQSRIDSLEAICIPKQRLTQKDIYVICIYIHTHTRARACVCVYGTYACNNNNKGKRDCQLKLYERVQGKVAAEGWRE